MDQTVQWAIVGIVVAAAAVYLLRRMARPTAACGRRCDCRDCPMGAGHAHDCEDRSQ